MTAGADVSCSVWGTSRTFLLRPLKTCAGGSVDSCFPQTQLPATHLHAGTVPSWLSSGGSSYASLQNLLSGGGSSPCPGGKWYAAWVGWGQLLHLPFWLRCFQQLLLLLTFLTAPTSCACSRPTPALMSRIWPVGMPPTFMEGSSEGLASCCCCCIRCLLQRQQLQQSTPDCCAYLRMLTQLPVIKVAYCCMTFLLMAKEQ